jgi:hypothetical protein
VRKDRTWSRFTLAAKSGAHIVVARLDLIAAEMSRLLMSCSTQGFHMLLKSSMSFELHGVGRLR